MTKVADDLIGDALDWPRQKADFVYDHGALVDIYIPDTINNRVQSWAPGASSGVTVAGGNGVGSAANQLNFPTGVALDTVGNIYIADPNNSRVQKVRSALQLLLDLQAQAGPAGLNPYLAIRAAQTYRLGAIPQTCALLASFTQYTRRAGATGAALRSAAADAAQAVGCLSAPAPATPH